MKRSQAIPSGKKLKINQRRLVFSASAVILACICICYIRIRPVLLTQPLVHAIKQGNVASVKAALDEGADPNAVFSVASGWDGADWEESRVDLLESLLGRQLHHVERVTPLFLATLEGKDDIAQLLIAHGADVHFRDGAGSTALMWAAHSCNPRTVQLLVDKGADVNARWKDGTPIIGEVYGRPEIVAILKQAGAKE
jgi:ankyrin repeat protein